VEDASRRGAVVGRILSRGWLWEAVGLGLAVMEVQR
jgi:hypothetical protein